MKVFLRFCAICLSAAVLFCALSGSASVTEPAEEVPAETEPTPEESLPAEMPQPELTSPENAGFSEFAFFAQSAEQAQEIARSMGTSLVNYQYGIGTLRLNDAASQRRSLLTDITLYPEFEYTVESQDAVPQPYEQWHLPILHAEEAWAAATGDGVLVAVIDTGIDSGHEDLTGAVFTAETVIPENYYGPEGMFLAEYLGSYDNLGHGTHVAGIIGARNNGTGCSGIAPQCSILSIKALEKSGTQGRGRSSWVAAAVNMAVEKGADIINLSLGGSLIKDELLRISIEKAVDAGVIVVCAAGNVKSPTVMYPGAYEETLAVSALKPQGDGVTFASGYSNSGDWIDFSAPGSDIVSTVPGGYGAKSGTSMSCGVISGAFALLLSQDPLLTANQAETIMQETILDLGQSGKDTKYGYGMPDLQAMTALLQNRLALHIPQTQIPSGSTLIQGVSIRLFTQTLHGNVVYTLDGTEPAAESPVWPNGGVTFPQDTEQVTITARTLRNDGELSASTVFTYSFVPAVTVLTEADVTLTDVIPGYAPYLDPVLNLPCRRYQIQVEPGYEMVITPSAELIEPQFFLFDHEGSDASKLKLTRKDGQLLWQNDSEEAKTVLLSLVMEETGREMSYSFQFSRREAAASPPETDPESTVPPTTVPSQTESIQTQPTATTEPLTEPAMEPATAPVTQEHEEDWLYTMEESTEPVAPELPPQMPTEKGEAKTMDTFDFRFLLAGGIIFIFGIGLCLLGYFTSRKSWLLIRDGQPACAKVLRVVRCADGQTYRYQLCYRTGNGEQITAFWNVYPRRRFARRHPEGSELKIKYLPESPKDFMVMSYPVTAFSSILVLIVGAGVMLLGSLLVFLMFQS